ncbi:hypothetical protein Gorai_021106 [Gossypium raimondii]|uniref:Uncharacterized protein n=1 Tax=Gossypium raimondii TaxID=29730 RepID=A0A7J8NPU5_GOSRA|nr:hypothetical protein [Gossypium raimondii]
MLPTVDFAMGAKNSSLTSGIGRATKSVHTKLKVQLDFDDPTVDNNGQRIQSKILKVSYKSTLLGASSEKNNGGFLDGDVVIEVIEGVPSIMFSNRVQEFIQRRMANTIIVKLLGGRIVDICPEITTAPPVEEPGCTRLVMEKSSLEKNVEDEPYVFNSEVNGSDEVVTKEKADGDGDMGLGFPEKYIIETKRKHAKLRAKGKKVVMGNGPKLALKVLNPNNGSLGMNLNIGRNAFDDGSRLAQVGAINRGKAIVKEKVEILTNLNKEKHAAVHILEKEKIGVNIDKENAMEEFVCDLERNPNKDVMVSDFQVVKECMIVDDTDGVEVSGARTDGIITKIRYPNSFSVETNGFAKEFSFVEMRM